LVFDNIANSGLIPVREIRERKEALKVMEMSGKLFIGHWSIQIMRKIVTDAMPPSTLFFIVFYWLRVTKEKIG